MAATVLAYRSATQFHCAEGNIVKIWFWNLMLHWDDIDFSSNMFKIGLDSQDNIGLMVEKVM